MDLSVVIVAYRTREDVRNCLASLFHGGLDGLTAEVILVDNGSGDGTVEMVRSEFPLTRLLAGDNVGFARGNNLGIEFATGRQVLLLNPDTLLPAGALARCVAELDSQSDDVAALSCRVESPDGSLQWTCARRLVTPWSECCRALLLDRVFAKSDTFNREPMVGWDRSDARFVECFLGAFLLVRRSAWDAIGGLDERFFLMYEDTDWCRRARDAGYRLLFWPGAHITHLGGQSWKQDPIRTFAATHESILIYFRKHHPRSLGVVRLVSRIGMALKVALLKARLMRKPGDAYALEHLEMARAAEKVLAALTPGPPGWGEGTPARGPGREGPPPSLLYVSTLDHIVHVMLPHLDAARARGWRVEVACQVTRFRSELEAHADRVHDLPMRRFPIHPANVAALARLTRLIRRERYTVVHCHNPTGGVVGRLAATLARVGSLRVYTAHGFHFHRQGGRVSNALYRAVETFAGRLLSDAVLVINREDYEAAKGSVVRADRLFLTGGVGVSADDDFNPATVSDAARAAIRAEWGVVGDAPLLTVIGEMVPRKRQIDALLAFARLRESMPDAVLALVGDGARLEALKAEAGRIGVSDGVRFPGFRSDTQEILAATDLFLFPSQQEGLPCAIQEALSMGVPVVATDVRGCADLIDPSCGRIVPPGDIEALADRARELLTLPTSTRRAMGAAGRERMLRLYDRPKCVAEWQSIYDQLIERRQSR